MNGHEIGKLTEGHTQNSIDGQEKKRPLVLYDIEKKSFLTNQTIDKKDESCEKKADGGQPAGVHSLSCEKELAHGAGQSPADPAKGRKKRTLRFL